MKRRYILAILSVVIAVVVGSCGKNFLNVKPVGSLSQDILASDAGCQAEVVGVYAMIDGKSSSFGWGSTAINWIYGDIRAAMASKGSDGGDQPYINSIQTYTELPTNDYLNAQWKMLYEGVARANNAIKIINQALGNGAITQENPISTLSR